MVTALRRERGLRVVLVSPFELPRLGLVRILESIEGVQVVADAATSVDGIKLASEYSPDVVVLDAELAADEGMTGIDILTSPASRTRVLLLADRAAQMQVETALEAGVDGFTLKDISVAELAATLWRLADGDTVLHPDAASAIARRLAANGREKPNGLTPRQREILRLLAAGLENKQIAKRLGIGVHTVKTHVSRVLNKLGVATRTEAVVLAFRDRLIS